MMLYLRGLIIGLLIFSWAMGYKFLSWDNNREFARNLAYATIRSAHIALCLLCYGWISKLALIDAVGAVLWGIYTAMMCVLVYALCGIGRHGEEKAKRIKIVDCSGDDYWYKYKIGSEYDVEEYNGHTYTVLDENVKHFVFTDDCVTIKQR